jgi:hypothetical protein
VPANAAFDPSDYTDCRTPQQRVAEREHVDRQIASLQRLATDNEYHRTVVDRLQRRRRGSRDRVQLEAVPRRRRLDVLVAAESVVARNADLSQGVRGRLRDELGVDSPAAGRAVVRLDVTRRSRDRDRDRDRDRMPRIVEQIRECGVDAAVNHVVPLAGFIKGAGGPEPSACARPFAGVSYPQHSPGPVVAVLDTGVSAEVRTDGYLAMSVDPEDVDRLDEFPPDGLLDAGAGHGAFVAGVIQQVAPTADVRIHKVVDSDGITTDAAIAERMRRAAAEGATIINLSLGTETLDGQAPYALREAVRDVREEGVLVVCAAGNSADTDPVWPAALAAEFDNVVSVAALDPHGDPAPWSSHGDWVRFSAIGEGVVSTYVIGTEDGELIDDPEPDTYERDSWACWTGTSFAAPQITGALVRLIQESPQPITPAQALAELENRASDFRKEGYGRGVQILPGT